MTTEPRRPCEHRDGSKQCTARASYRVARYGRRLDAQLSCRRHLAVTVDALEEGDGKPIVVEHL